MTPETVIPFQTINWAEIPGIDYPGETGTAYWQTVEFTGLRIRVVTYSPGYLANHWCHKGHIVYCLQGAFISELESGESFVLTAGMSYVVSDEISSHRSLSAEGVQLLIIDGDFLKSSIKDRNI